MNYLYPQFFGAKISFHDVFWRRKSSKTKMYIVQVQYNYILAKLARIQDNDRDLNIYCVDVRPIEMNDP